MNTKLIKFLLVLCSLLLGIIAAEWFYAQQVQKQTLAALKVTDKKTPKIAQMPSINLTQKPEQSFTDLVERPLFIKGRRPVPEIPTDPKQPTAKPTGPFNWQLNGVYTKKSGLYALLSRSVRQPKNNFRKLTQGADIDGWTLSLVQKDKVVLNQGALQKELLLRKPKPKNAPHANAEPGNPKTTPEQEQAANQAAQQQPPGQPEQPMAEPLPNGETVPEPIPDDTPPESYPDTEAMPEPDASVMPEEPMPEPDAETMPEEPMPEPEPEMQPDQF